LTKITSPLPYKYLNSIKTVDTEVWIRNVDGKEIFLHVFRKSGKCQNIGINSGLVLTDQDQGKGKGNKKSRKNFEQS